MKESTMISKLARTALLAAIVCSVWIPAAKAAHAAQAGGSTAAATEPAPFARVYLAIKGCTSCAHCRTTIRQMVNTKSAGGETRMSADQVEVRYPKPSPVPLKDVIHSLAENRLHDLSLVDVLFEARGT